MNRPPLEAADIFREYGSGYLAEFGGSLSSDQRRALHDIMRCRTAALGGHVEGCDRCGHRRIAYILYTRWEYSDRTAGYLHSLFVMNPDGTGQTEFYGNNSQFPAAILHGRSVPGSTKVIAISGAHHIDQRGKLSMIDRNVDTQAGFGVKFLAPERDYPGRGIPGDDSRRIV